MLKILLGLVIMSAASFGNSADGWRFRQQEFQRDSFQVNMVYHQNEDEIRRAMQSAGGNPTFVGRERLYGFSILKEGNVCEIHVIHPRTRYKPEIMGHELTHCAFGRWHD